MSKSIIKPRSSTKAEWESVNPILRKQEVAYEVPDEGIGKGKIKMKQGDGITDWIHLPYAGDNVNADELVVSSFDTITDENPVLSVGQSIKHYFGVIKKKFDYYAALINSKIGIDKIYSGLDSSNSTQVLAAPAGKQLKELCDNNAQGIVELNSNLEQTNNNLNGFEGRFQFLSADKVSFDFVDQSSYFKTIKDGIIQQTEFQPNGIGYDKLVNSIWHRLWSILLTNLIGVDFIYDPTTNSQIIKWRVSDNMHYQLVVGQNGINYDRWDGTAWTTIWSK